MMAWLKKKKPIPTLPPEHQASIEIIAHHDAGKEVKQQSDLANKQLKRLLEDNHFTLRIYLAAGGKNSRKQKV